MTAEDQIKIYDAEGRLLSDLFSDEKTRRVIIKFLAENIKSSHLAKEIDRVIAQEFLTGYKELDN